MSNLQMRHSNSRTLGALIATLCMVFILALPVCAQKFYGESGYAEFESRAPGLTFKGTSDHLTGLIDISERTVDFYLDLNTLDTGIRLRNRHMRDSYLNTREHPFAEFLGTMRGEVDIRLADPQPVTATGKFTIHGITQEREVEGTLTFSNGGNTVRLQAYFEVLLDDHNIDRPRVVFYELSELQRVTIDIKMDRYED